MNLKVLFKASANMRLHYSLSKIMLIMRLTTIILLVACMQVSATAFSQKVTVVGENISLKKVFKDIRKQTDYNFIYSNKTLKDATKVTLSIENESLQLALKKIFKHQPLAYDVENKIIIIREKSNYHDLVDSPTSFVRKEITGIVDRKSTRL